ncbi:MAG: GAF domain-containing sensor histidine kinase, partial [Acetobacteraceae bacterium]|nr:GAF domain-containing sensor histidine kinase [Acetobacteraceae bacterium]
QFRRIADEQAALRRVATLVAEPAPPEKVYAAVAEEIALHQVSDVVALLRYEEDGMATVVGGWAVEGIEVPLGERLMVAGEGVAVRVLQTNRPGYVDDLNGPPGSVAAWLRELGIQSAIGTPIVVESELWGVVAAASRQQLALPARSEAKIAEFTELVATAIANTETREGRRHLANQQAALLRVATLVARGVAPEAIFAAVAEEAAMVLPGVDITSIGRYTPEQSVEFVGAWSRMREGDWVGKTVPIGGRNVATVVFDTGQPARVDQFEDDGSALSAIGRVRGTRSVVGAPITVEGQVWGMMTVGSVHQDRLPAGIENELAGFIELVATAIANAQAQADLAASRARVVASADETRRKIERDLHDGAQQQLVTLTLQLRAVQAVLPPGHELAVELDGIAAGLNSAIGELRELAAGIHPPVLAAGGLGPAVRTLGRRSPIPVEVDLRTDGRMPEPIEVGAYYVVSEALTNAVKHSRATSVAVDIEAQDDVLRILVQDDGIGGAEFARGSGLLGLRDRVEALSGRIALDSKRGAGTSLSVELPLAAEPSDSRSLSPTPLARPSP